MLGVELENEAGQLHKDRFCNYLTLKRFKKRVNVSLTELNIKFNPNLC